MCVLEADSRPDARDKGGENGVLERLTCETAVDASDFVRNSSLHVFCCSMCGGGDEWCNGRPRQSARPRRMPWNRFRKRPFRASRNNRGCYNLALLFRLIIAKSEHFHSNIGPSNQTRTLGGSFRFYFSERPASAI